MNPPSENETPPTGRTPEGGEVQTSDSTGSLSDLMLEGKIPRPLSPREAGPYCWQSKAALRRLLDDQECAFHGSRLAIYCALTFLSSNGGGSPTFVASRAAIVRASGQGLRTVRRALVDLQDRGLIHVRRQFKPGAGKPEELASEITLLSVEQIGQNRKRVGPNGQDGEGPNCTEGDGPNSPKGYGHRRASTVAHIRRKGSVPSEHTSLKEERRSAPPSARSRPPLRGDAARGGRGGGRSTTTSDDLPDELADIVARYKRPALGEVAT